MSVALSAEWNSHTAEGATLFRPTYCGYRCASFTFSPRARQQGVTLLISLIVLVIMTLAGIELMRSVDTTNIIAGNLAFQEAATNSGDSGIEAAIGWLEQQSATNAANLYNDQDANPNCNGYTSNYVATNEPPYTGTWDTWWNGLAACQIVTLPTDAAGNTASYAINRMCSAGNLAPTTSIVVPIQHCSASTITVTGSQGNSQGSGNTPLQISGQVYYRITSRISGPRGTKSYVQAIAAM
jgi:Tfp pilus assembly protein PilX